MNKKWLFLRGEFDGRTQQSINDDDDMWLQLFREIAGDDEYLIWFRNEHINSVEFIGERIIMCSLESILRAISLNIIIPDYAFTRGGFSYYLPILGKLHDAIKLRYGAGRRYMPELSIKYDLCIVDSAKQVEDIKAVYEGQKILNWTKPAANHFKPEASVEKEFDICYIGNYQQQHIKGMKWLYDTVPDHYRVLHLGYQPKCAKENIDGVRVARARMPKMINKCKIGIVPYWDSPDSEPRAISEMIACGLKVFVGEGVCCNNREGVTILDRESFWEKLGRACWKDFSSPTKNTIKDAAFEIKKELK